MQAVRDDPQTGIEPWMAAAGQRHRDVLAEDIQELLAQTHDPDPKVRKLAVHYLCPCEVKHDVPPVWDRLLAMVDDPDPKVRAQVLHTLCDGSPRGREAQVVAAVEQLRNDPDEGLRRRVRKLLAQYQRTGKINVL
jgi:HEAT repeat protein